MTFDRTIRLLYRTTIVGLIMCCIVFALWVRQEAKTLALGGDVYVVHRDFEKAHYSYSKTRAFVPVSKNARLALYRAGALCFKEQQYACALEHFEYLQRYEHSDQLTYLVAQSLVGQGRFNAARSYYYKLLEQDQYTAVAQEELGLIALSQNDPQEALSWFNRAGNEGIKTVRGQYFYSLLLLRERPDDAVLFLKTLVQEHSPDSAYVQRAQTLLDRLEAMSDAEIVEVQYLVALASTLNGIDEPVFAKEFINQAIERAPNYRDAFIVRAENALLLGDEYLAEQDCQRVLELDPEEGEALCTQLNFVSK